ncbi:TPA: P-type conjugative transfer protein TrbL, partial [Campylobacter fetus subsp. venerealis]|nr:P-type conjugative transfer protein TrbL [Campylobacter fetus subsp. venerealis]HDX8134166.1 P-type conjugative transfer protein TrbL [Campylobacter fetus subsp. venerealis]HDX8141774.1 P-type conjugative transfer protein TrbL [Campylobacter fetus subsp. venerealis]
MKPNKSIALMQIEHYFYATIISTIHTIQIKLGRQHSNNKIKILFILFILFTLNSEALAIDSSQSILNTLHIGLKGWIPTIKSACLYVFWTLVAIDLVWTFGIQALRGFEIGEFLATLIKKIVFIGVIIFLFQVDYWLKLLFDSFSQLATNATGTSILPGSIITSGVEIILAIWDSAGINIAKTLFLLLCGLIILIGFVLMAINLLIAYLKFYIMNIIVFFALALSGLERFKEIGLNPIMTAIKVGVELFMIQAFMGLCVNITDKAFYELSQNMTVDLTLQIVVIALIFCMITKMIPGLIEAVFNGSIGESAGAAAGFRAVAAMAAGAVATGVAGSIGVTRAMNAAKALHLAEGGKGGMDLVKGVAKNLATTGGEHLKDNFRHGRMPNDIANRLQEKAKSAMNSNLSGGFGGSSNVPNEPYIS